MNALETMEYLTGKKRQLQRPVNQLLTDNRSLLCKMKTDSQRWKFLTPYLDELIESKIIWDWQPYGTTDDGKEFHIDYIPYYHISYQRGFWFEQDCHRFYAYINLK